MVWVIAFGELFFGDLWCVVWGYGGMRTHFSLLNPVSPPTAPTNKKSPRENSRGDFTVPDDGFEPTKAMPTDLQSAPFGRSGNLACTLKRCEWNATHYSVIYTNRQVRRIFSYLDSPLSRAHPSAELNSQQKSLQSRARPLVHLDSGAQSTTPRAPRCSEQRGAERPWPHSREGQR